MNRSEIVGLGLCVMGFCNAEEMGLLYDLVMLAPPKNHIVEIGVWFGRTLTVLGLAAGDQLVVGIDPFAPGIQGSVTHGPATFVQARVTLDFYGLSSVLLIPGCSHAVAQIWGAPISVLFIDGLHTEESLSEDIDDWLRYVVVGGCVAFHDYGHPAFPGVRCTVDSWAARGENEWIEAGLIGFVKAFRRVR